MTFWEFFDRAGQRRMDVANRTLPHDFRGWVALALFVQSSSLFGLMWIKSSIMDNQGFMTLASAVIITGWVGGVAAFAYSAGKREGEQSAALNKALDLAVNNQPITEPDVTLQPGETAQAAPATGESS